MDVKTYGVSVPTKDQFCTNAFNNNYRYALGLGQINILAGNNDYKVGDTLIVSVPENSVRKHLKFEKKAKVFLIGGKHMGETGTVEDIKQNRIIYKNDREEGLETLKKYAFVIE